VGTHETNNPVKPDYFIGILLITIEERELSPELSEYIRLSTEHLATQPDVFIVPNLDWPVRKRISKMEADVAEDDMSTEGTSTY
jgi:hypothetical protein